jgi:serine/threonine-protein kinase
MVSRALALSAPPGIPLVTDDTSARHPLLATRSTQEEPAAFLRATATVFATFDQQDSGNVSFGVRVGPEAFFVKTAGAPAASAPLPLAARVALLHNAARIAGELPDPALPRLLNCFDSTNGPILVYEWFPGELVGVPRRERSNPGSAFARFTALPLPTICRSLSTIFRVHAKLAQRGWIASDFYDGCVMYDFVTHDLRLVDLDHYRQGAFTNDMGRMFGSTRFMAPEEHALGSQINELTTVFNMGRCITVFLREPSPQLQSPATSAILRVEEKACQENPSRRYNSMADLLHAWQKASAPLTRCEAAG